MAGETKQKKKKKKTEYSVDIWQKEPTAEEQKEINELAAICERDGIEMDHVTLRRGIVNENIPKHMTLITRDFNDERRDKQEEEQFALT